MAVYADVMVSAKVRNITDKSKIGLLLRYQDKNNGYIFYRDGTKIRIGKLQNGGLQVLAGDLFGDPSTFYLRDKDWYIKASAQGQNLSVWHSIDGDTWYGLNAVDPTFTQGKVGLYIEDTFGFFDDVRVERFSSGTLSLGDMFAWSIQKDESQKITHVKVIGEQKLWKDEFQWTNQLEDWTVLSGYWYSGGFILGTTSPSGGIIQSKYYGTEHGQTTTIKLFIKNMQGKAAILFKMADVDNAYKLTLEPTGLYLRKIEDGSPTTLGSYLIPIKNDETHEISARTEQTLTGYKIECFLDSEERIEKFDSTFTEGYFAVESDSPCQFMDAEVLEQIEGEAEDTALSAKWGRKTLVITDSEIRSKGKAQAKASAQLSLLREAKWRGSVEVPVNTILREGDIVDIKVPDEGLDTPFTIVEMKKEQTESGLTATLSLSERKREVEDVVEDIRSEQLRQNVKDIPIKGPPSLNEFEGDYSSWEKKWDAKLTNLGGGVFFIGILLDAGLIDLASVSVYSMTGYRSQFAINNGDEEKFTTLYSYNLQDWAAFSEAHSINNRYIVLENCDNSSLDILKNGVLVESVPFAGEGSGYFIKWAISQDGRYLAVVDYRYNGAEEYWLTLYEGV